MRQIVLIAHNIRSAHNVGSLLRTAEGLGVESVYLTGYTPYPKISDDLRLPHIARSTHNKIAKTALGAENKNFIFYQEDINLLLMKLKKDNFIICGLEQDELAVELPDYKPENKIALIVGRETLGLEPEILRVVDDILQIPMFGDKESFNVCQAATMALYHLRFT